VIAPTRLGRERDRRNGRPPASRRTVPVRRVGFCARLGSARSAAQPLPARRHQRPVGGCWCECPGSPPRSLVITAPPAAPTCVPPRTAPRPPSAGAASRTDGLHLVGHGRSIASGHGPERDLGQPVRRECLLNRFALAGSAWVLTRAQAVRLHRNPDWTFRTPSPYAKVLN